MTLFGRKYFIIWCDKYIIEYCTPPKPCKNLICWFYSKYIEVLVIQENITISFKRISIINLYCYSPAKDMSQEKEPLSFRDAFWHIYRWNDMISRMCFKIIREWRELYFTSMVFLPNPLTTVLQSKHEKKYQTNPNWAIFCKIPELYTWKLSMSSKPIKFWETADQRRLKR